MPNRYIPSKTRKNGKMFKEYVAWISMKDRCYNPRNPRFHCYGGRGITVCDRWKHSFHNFLADVGYPPTREHSLDRIDSNGNYEPGNVQWATEVAQQRNRTNNTILEFRGERRTIAEWAEVVGINQWRISGRLRLGWSTERALTEPVITNPKHKKRRLLEWKGRSLSTADWSRLTGIKRSTIEMRLDAYGWSVEKALSTPVPSQRRLAA